MNPEAGKQESKALNNHGSGYNAQVSSIAIFLNKENIAKKIVQTTAHRGYSVFNLSGLFWLASIGQHIGMDLWDYKSHHGSGLQKALDYLLSYTDPRKMHAWP